MSENGFDIWWRDFEIPEDWYSKWIMCGGTDTKSSRFEELEGMVDFLTDTLSVAWQAAQSKLADKEPRVSSKLNPNACTLTSQICAALAEATVHGEHLDHKAQLAIDFLSQAIERLHALVLELTDKVETT